MHLNILLDQIREKACKDADFKARILDADESVYAAMRRSTNGGGENSPHLSWEENIIEEFVRELQ